jgi:hypothetical protein
MDLTAMLNLSRNPKIKVSSSFQSTGSTGARQCSEVVVNIAKTSEPLDESKKARRLLLRLHSAQEEKCREELCREGQLRPDDMRAQE